MIAAVVVSCGRPQSAMSPAPTNTGSAPAAVRKVQVGPVVVAFPSLTVTYHSYCWPESRLGHVVVVLLPDATLVFCAIWAKMPLAEGRPKKVTVSGLASGSETPTSSVGEVPVPLAPFVGELTIGASGARFPGGGGTKP